jgi:N-acetylglucosaminyldiphosphoundecaprenol N-acetyl-beta-D-mannosaminyltransferase
MQRPGPSSAAPATVSICGLEVSARSFQDTAALLTEWACQREQLRYFACLNSHSIEVAHRDPAFMDALQMADIRVADGFGVILASRLLRSAISERSTGPDLFMEVSRRLSAVGGCSVFYLGGSTTTLQRIEARHRECFPNLGIAGSFSPPFQAEFSEQDVDVMVALINKASPNVLWVGLGAPKQEKWIRANIHRLKVSLCGPVGAMFDYFAGNIPRPPRWVEQAGLHWAYRLGREPFRLWRRNLDSPLFLARVVAQRLWHSSGRAQRGDIEC